MNKSPSCLVKARGARRVVQSSKFRLCHNCGQIKELVSGWLSKWGQRV